ncbi:hypothetical protein [Pseudonocardia spinosispora]|uniref:hypothetical protein n=1 Tax=Pseudonocardia spinosispora TaxID=103441 RepID=UPI0003F7ACEA|nr:hypothetical protein [Pseudonocardia spinosispora]
MSRETPRTLLEQLIAAEPYTWAELEDRFNRFAREHARETGERATSISWNQLQRIAAGKVPHPRPATTRVLEKMFGRPVTELVAAEILGQAETGCDDEDMRRRALLGAAGGIVLGGALANLDPVRRQLDAALDGPITEHDAFEWERAADEYSRLVSSVPADQLLPELITDLDDARRHLDRSPHAMRLRLARACALLGGLTAISLVGAGRWTAASRYWRLADRAARLSGDRGVTSLIAGRRAVFTTYAPWAGPVVVMSLAADALRWGEDKPSAGTTSALAARAQVLAMQGDRTGARDTLAELERVFDRLDDVVRQATHSEWSWSETRLRHVRSFVASHSGDVPEAAAAQDAALAGYGTPVALGASQIRLHQAMSMITAGDPSGGAQHVVAVLESLAPSFRRGHLRTMAVHALRLLPERATHLPEVRKARELVAAT